MTRFFSSFDRDNILRGISGCDTQCTGSSFGIGCSKNLCLGTGAILRLLSGLYHLFMIILL